MPHCIIEFSNDLNTRIKETVKTVTVDIENSGLFDKRTIKTRAIPINDYLVGGTEESFIHVTVKMLEGRSGVQKKELSQRILSSVMKLYDIENISVEIMDLHTYSYSKKETLK